MPTVTRRVSIAILALILSHVAHADVDLRTGSFADTAVDFKISDSPQLVWSRTYFSNRKTLGTLGESWSGPFDIRLAYSEPGFLQVVTTAGVKVYWLKGRSELSTARARIGLMTQSIADVAKREQVIHLLMEGDSTYDLQWGAYLAANAKGLNTLSSLKNAEFMGPTAQDGVIRLEKGRLTWQLASGEERIFSLEGKLVEIKNSIGRVTAQYANDRVSKIEVLSPEKVEFSFEYAGNKLTRVTRKGTAGAVVEYSYDSKNRLVRVVDSLKNRVEYRYEDVKGVSLLSQVVGIGGTQQEIQYEKSGKGFRVKSAKLGVGLEARFTYDDRKHPAGIYVTNVVRTIRLPKQGAKEIKERHEWLTNRSSAKELYVFKEVHQTGKTKIEVYRNEFGLPVLEKTPVSKTLYQYDSAGLLTSKMTPDEIVTYKYDNRGNLIQVASVHPKHSKQNASADLSYDRDGRLSGFKTADGIDARFSRDSLGRVTSMRDAGSKVKLDVRYDGASRIQSVSSEEYGIFKFSYDANGQMKSLIAPENQKHFERLNTWWSRFDSVLRLSQKGGL